MKKTVALLLLFVLSLSPLFCQDLSSGTSAERILQIIHQLEDLNSEREIYLTELESINEERKNELLERETELGQRKAELQQRIDDLNQKEKELKELKVQLELFGNLIDDQANYSKNLEKKLAFWRTTTVVFSVSTLSLIIALLVVGK